MSWIDTIVNTIRVGVTDKASKHKAMPEGLWAKCDSCNTVSLSSKLKQDLYTCNQCNHHMYIPARDRLLAFLDVDSTQELEEDLVAIDVLKFKDNKKYTQRISQDQAKSKEKDALIVMSGTLNLMPVIACAFEFKFMGGSMGSVVGEKFVNGAKLAIEKKCPFICFSASGGARMQENMFSLMQMARTAAIIEKMKRQSIPFISVLTNPTFGGVTASLAMLGTINIAEPNALIGFAGPKVIEQTVKQVLPAGFQRSEFLLQRGAIDSIIDRQDLKSKIASILAMLTQNTTQHPKITMQSSP